MPPKRTLDKATVVKTAADLLNREGVDALTLNRLAGILGIQTPSLYNHIDGMAGLRRELALLNLRQLADCLGAAAMGHSGVEGLKVVAGAYRLYIKENPGLYLTSLRASGNLSAPDSEQRAQQEMQLEQIAAQSLQAGEEDVLRIVLRMLDSLGLSGMDAIHAARGLRSAVHGFATLEIAGGFGIRLDLDESFARLIGTLAKGLEQPGLQTPGLNPSGD